jgi:hypothetical protein
MSILLFLFGLGDIKAQNNDPNQSKFKPQKQIDVTVNPDNVNGAANIEKNTDLPLDYPIYISTGNPTLDEENYKQAKLLWYATHTDLTKTFLSSRNIDDKLIISQEQFDALPQSRKEFILANPEQYSIK